MAAAKIGDFRILKTEQVDFDEHDRRRVASPGLLVEVVDVFRHERTIAVGCPETGANWFFTQKQWDAETEKLKWPDNPFKNSKTLFIAMKTDREKTIGEIMDRIIVQWYDDGGDYGIIEGLTKWAIEGINLGDDKTLLGLAESHLEETE